MSRWLKSVNTLLETLDGQVENVVDERQQQENHASRDAVGHVLSQRGLATADDEYYEDDDDEDEDEDDDDYESDYEEQEEEEEEEQGEWLDSEEYDEEEEDEEVIDLEAAPASGALSQSDRAPPPPLFPETPAEMQVAVQKEEPNTSLQHLEAPRPPPPPPPHPSSQEPAPMQAATTSSSSALSSQEITETEKQETSSPESVVKVEIPDAAEMPSSTNNQALLAPSSTTGSNQPHNKPPQPPPPPPPRPPISGLSRTDESAPASGQWSLASHPSHHSAHPQQQQQRTATAPSSSSTTTTNNKDLKRVEAEARQLRKHVLQLNAKLEASEAECRAQRDELRRAAERLERDRTLFEQERNELMDEQDDEVDQLKEHYEALLAEQAQTLQEQVNELHERLRVEEEMRAREGTDWTEELEESVQREREALQKLGQVREENVALQSSVAKLETQQSALQSRLEVATQNAQAAWQRERDAEDKLDAALSLHSRQLSQRQAREAELERTIGELGAALAAARQEQNRRGGGDESVGRNNNNNNRMTKQVESSTLLKEQFDFAVDELETVKAQLSMETQQCEALRQELKEMSQERNEEASAARTRQEQYDRQIADLNGTIARLQSTVRGTQKTDSRMVGAQDASDVSDPAVAKRLSDELEQAKKQISSLSEQLIRQQSKNETSKTELLTLRNRLQSAVARAENAEQALASASSAQSDVGTSIPYGGSTMRRRIKGGRARMQSTSVQSIRSALNLRPGRVNEGAEPFVATLDAIDSMAVETGAFFRHEPLARLGFLLYLLILHIWAFCVVLFHAHSIEKEHADFGSLKVGPPP